MALFKFTKAMLAGEKIQVYNYGKHRRDFTYIDDIVEGIFRTLNRPAASDPKWDSASPDPGSSKAPWRVYNIGNSDPVQLMDFISALEDALGKKAVVELLPLQSGDVPDTFADVQNLSDEFDFQPATPVKVGVSQFISWYRQYFKV